MIATAIQNNLTSKSWCRLMLKKEEITWKKSDGIDVNIGVQSGICAIELAKLSGYGNSPLKMLNGMELIRDNSGKSIFTTKQFTIQ
eukprot:9937291-Ditylum_brightwellii.AAC.1